MQKEELYRTGIKKCDYSQLPSQRPMRRTWDDFFALPGTQGGFSSTKVTVIDGAQPRLHPLLGKTQQGRPIAEDDLPCAMPTSDSLDISALDPPNQPGLQQGSLSHLQSVQPGSVGAHCTSPDANHSRDEKRI